MNNAIIPGMLPLPPVNSNNIIRPDPLGGINAVIYESSAEERPTFNVVIQTREGKSIYTDPLGEWVFRKGDEYRLITDYRKDVLPLGTSYLWVLVDNKKALEFFIQLDEDVFQVPKFVDVQVVLTGFSQVSQFDLAMGVQTVTVYFPIRFAQPPTVIIPVVYPDVSADEILLLTATVTYFDANKFTVRLSGFTNTSGYRLGWAAWV